MKGIQIRHWRTRFQLSSPLPLSLETNFQVFFLIFMLNQIHKKRNPKIGFLFDFNKKLNIIL
ncbi:MAG: hypothetical protein RIQ33_462 [Bacteroidota bacterium]